VKNEPYDFLVQSPTWKLGAVTISILRKQFDKTYVAVAFDNSGRTVTLNFILVKGPEGWLISDVESPHDSLRMFLDQFRN
jgi:ribulose bisphosphate carboxylase small subunit